MKTLRIATRKSPLARWQAEYVKTQLQQLYPDLTITLVAMTTKGDEILDKSLAKIGGKGLFIKELEKALLEGRADIAVHSLKDMPASLPEGLLISTICQRHDPRDAFLSPQYSSFLALPLGAIVGTSSLRRQAQCLHWRDDLIIKPLRGNINTRIDKLIHGEFDAIILAVAGVQRLQLSTHLQETFSLEKMLPAVGQGALAIECRNDPSLIELLSPLHHTMTAQCVYAERAVNLKLQGSCQVPIAAHAFIKENTLILKAMVAEPDASQRFFATATGDPTEHQQLGEVVANDLLAQGAQTVLDKFQ